MPAACDFMARIIGETWVIDALHCRVGLEEAGQRQRIGRLPLDAHAQRPDPASREPGVERPEVRARTDHRGADAVHGDLHFIGDFLRPGALEPTRRLRSHQPRQVAGSLGRPPLRRTTPLQGMPALDAGLLAAAQAVEHYEMSRYGTLKTWAGELGMPDAVSLLDATLKEEKATDSALTTLAKSVVNIEAEAHM